MLGFNLFCKKGLSEPEFYGDLVYKFRKNIYACNDFSTQFH